MASPQHEEFALAQRRKQAAELYLQGCTQSSIAVQLGIAQSTVSEDLQHVRQAWHDSAGGMIDEIREKELAKLDLLESEGWAAWERSKKPAQSAVVTGDGTGKQTRKSMKNQNGDPRFLDQINKCIAQRRQLLGLDILPVTPSVDGGIDDHATLEVRRERIFTLLTAISQRDRISTAGAGPAGDQPGDVRDGGQQGTVESGPAPDAA